MIIQLTIDTDEFDALSAQEMSAFTHQVVNVTARGKHLVLGRRALIGRLLEIATDNYSNAILKKLLHDQTQTGGAISSATWYVRVVADPSPNDSGAIEISTNSFLNGALDYPATLITENHATDGYIYETIIRVLARRAGIPSIGLDHAHGGGDDMQTVVERYVRENLFFAVFIDSDLKTPYSSKSQKSHSIEKILKSYDYGLSLILHCHEVENLLTDEVLQLLDQWKSNGDVDTIVKIYDDGREEVSDFFLFFDLKQGLTLDVASSFDQPERDYLETQLSALGVNKIDGFGNHIAKSTVTSGESVAALRQVISTRFWRRNFEEMFAPFCYWFASCRPTRI